MGKIFSCSYSCEYVVQLETQILRCGWKCNKPETLHALSVACAWEGGPEQRNYSAHFCCIQRDICVIIHGTYLYCKHRVSPNHATYVYVGSIPAALVILGDEMLQR